MGRQIGRWGRLGLLCAGLALPGCLPHYPDEVRQALCGPTSVPLDVQSVSALGPPRDPPAPDSAEGEKLPPPKDGKQRLVIPPELPGADAPPIKLPPLLPKTPEEREKIIQQLYQQPPPLGVEPEPPPGPQGRPLTLADLQELASASSPVLRRAVADINAARGVAVQVGLYPNPTVGYAGDQVQPAANAGQQGVILQQLIKTGGKLQLARAAAGMDVRNAAVALRQTQVEVAARVRAGYFAVLVARESAIISRALAELADEVFRIQVAQVKGGQAAAYEPLQLYVFAMQARNTLIQARNRYVSAWQQLAATLGMPGMPITALAGRADVPVPQFDYQSALERVSTAHTEMQTAENTILRARYALRLAEVTPLPDLQTQAMFQHDYSSGNFQFSVQLGVTVPVFDRNQGHIFQARAQVTRAQEDLEATRNDLARRVAEAFERYSTAVAQAMAYREQILGNQVRVFRAIRDRYQQEPDKVTYADIVNAQLTLSTALTTYLGLLTNQWTAVVDVAQLLQFDELYPPGYDACPADDSGLRGLVHP
ncbi:MAG: TolC family protein [Gemmataceae bacterium]|nr:TolC family protein [Gemmataceae bacterium]